MLPSSSGGSISSLGQAMQSNSLGGLGMQCALEATSGAPGLPSRAMPQYSELLQADKAGARNTGSAAGSAAPPALGYVATHQQPLKQEQGHLPAAAPGWQSDHSYSHNSISNGSARPAQPQQQQQQLQDSLSGSHSQASPSHNGSVAVPHPHAAPASQRFPPASLTTQGMYSMPAAEPYMQVQGQQQQQQAAVGPRSSAPASTAPYPLSPSLHVQLLGSRSGSSNSHLEALLPDVASPPSTPGSLAGTADVQQYWLQLQQQQQQEQAMAAARAGVPGVAPRYPPSPVGMPAVQWHSSSSKLRLGSDGAGSISSVNSAAPSVAASCPASLSSAPGYQAMLGMQHPHQQLQQQQQQQSSSAAASHAGYFTPGSAFDAASSSTCASAATANSPVAAHGGHTPLANDKEGLLRRTLLQMLEQQQQQQQQQQAPSVPCFENAPGAYPGEAAFGALSPQHQQLAAMQFMQQPAQQHQQQQQDGLEQLAQQLLGAMAADGPSGSSNSSVMSPTGAMRDPGTAGSGVSAPPVTPYAARLAAGATAAAGNASGAAADGGAAQYNGFPASTPAACPASFPASNNVLAVTGQQPLHQLQQQPNQQYQQQYQQPQLRAQQPQQYQQYQQPNQQYQQPNQQYQQPHQQYQQYQQPQQQYQQPQQQYQQQHQQYQQHQLQPPYPQPHQHQHHQQQQHQHQHYPQQQQQQLGWPAPAAAAGASASPFAQYGPTAGGSGAGAVQWVQQAGNPQSLGVWGQPQSVPWSSEVGQAYLTDTAHASPHAVLGQQQQQQQQAETRGSTTAGTAPVDAQANQMLGSPYAAAVGSSPAAETQQDQQQQQQQGQMHHNQLQQSAGAGALATAAHSSQQVAADAAAAAAGAGSSQLTAGFFPASLLTQPGPNGAALGPYMAAAAAAAMAPHHPAMLMPYHPGAAMMAPPAMMQADLLQAAAAAAQRQGMGMAMPMAYGMYPAVHVPFPMHMSVQMPHMPAAAGMHYWQAMQHQYFAAAAAAAAQGGAGASVSAVSPSDAGDMFMHSATASPSPAAPGAAAAGASAEAQGLQEAAATSSALQRVASAGVVAAEPRAAAAARGGVAGLWPSSTAEAALAWLLGRGFMAASYAAQHPGPTADSTAHGKQVAVPAPSGLAGLGLRIVSVPVTVLVSARYAVASGVGLVTYSTAAAARLSVMGVVWFAHYQLVLLLYMLLATSAAVLASQQLAWGTGRAALMLTWQSGVFALRQGRLFAGAAARVVASDLRQLPQQVLLSHPLLAAQPLTLGPGSASKLLLAAPEDSAAAADVAQELQTKGSSASWDGAAWARSALDYLTGASKPGATQLVASGAAAGLPPSAALVSSAAHGQQQQQQQQQGVVASSTGLLGSQQQQQQQGNSSSSLAVADSLSVISGLWAGLWLKLWLLLSIQAPYMSARIWLGAAGQGVTLSIAAVHAAAAYALHAVQLLLQCSALLLAHSRLQLPAAWASALSAAVRAGGYAVGLARRVVSVWWNTFGASAAAAGHELLQSAAEAVPGGAVLLQLLSRATAVSAYAVQATAAVLRSSWRFFAAAGEEDWRGINAYSGAMQLLAWAASAAGWVSLRGLSAAERLAVVVATRVLQGAHPMAQAAVWGSAGMLKRLVVETTQQSWLLLVQLYQAWLQQQQQQQQQQ